MWTLAATTWASARPWSSTCGCSAAIWPSPVGERVATVLLALFEQLEAYERANGGVADQKRIQEFWRNLRQKPRINPAVRRPASELRPAS